MLDLVLVQRVAVIILILERDAIDRDVRGADRLPLVECDRSRYHLKVHMDRLKRLFQLRYASVRRQNFPF